MILTQCDNNDPIDIDNNAVVAIVSRPQAVLAFAVVGTRLKTNGRSTGKQSGTKGWSGRCKEEKEVGPRTRQKKTKKDPKKTEFFGGGQLKRLKDARSVADRGKGKGEEGFLLLQKKYFCICLKRFLSPKKIQTFMIV